MYFVAGAPDAAVDGALAAVLIAGGYVAYRIPSISRGASTAS